jgi:small subunit ribosomal protein S21
MNRKAPYTQRPYKARRQEFSPRDLVPGLKVTNIGDGPRDFERALRTWSKKVQDSGLLRDLKERECYEKPSVIRKREKAIARKRWLRSQEPLSAKVSRKKPKIKTAE